MLTKVEVKGLYDVFDHTIILKDEGISLIIGENGLGKTLILKLIKAFFNKDFADLGTHHFKRLIFHFSGDYSIDVERVTKNNVTKLNFSNNHDSKKFAFEVNKGLSWASNIKYLRDEEAQLHLDLDNLEKLETVNTHYFNTKHNTKYYEMNDKLITKIPVWLSVTISPLKIKFIDTQRLLYRHSKNKSYDSSVEVYSQKLAEKIKDITIDANENGLKLDRSFPERIINEISIDLDIPIEDINTGLNKLRDERIRLSKVGLLVEQDNINDISEKLSQEFLSKNFLKQVLKIYIDDTVAKLSEYNTEGFASKLNLFIDLINKRFLHKELTISKETGFVFTSKLTLLPIPLESLSSGEQHELILFYQLLFDIKANTLLLIDEPEISLHISWQNAFINDLREIKKLNDFTAIIATHSPDIIGKNWNLTTKLNGIDI